MLPLTIALAGALGALGVYTLTLRQRIVASGEARDRQGELLAAERSRHLEERGAWAAAAAGERVQLLTAAADERAALVGAIDAARTGAVPYVAAPWPAQTHPGTTTAEEDEVREEREAIAARIDAEARARGVDLSVAS